MEKIKIVLLEEDEAYVGPIEIKLLKELKDNIDLHIITKREYFEEFKNTPIDADVLVTSEDFYSKDLEKHNIKSIIVLTEENTNLSQTANLNLRKVYKYTTVKEICKEIIDEKFIQRENKIKSKVISIYSPIGGVGKTTTAIGIILGLNNLKKRALYINTESVQSLLFEEDKFARSELIQEIKKKSENVGEIAIKNIVKGKYDYIPLIEDIASSVDIGIEEYIYLIEKIKLKNVYDFIVVDTTVDFTKEKSKLLAKSDKVIVLGKQDKMESKKINRFSKNIDCSNGEKFIFVCNKYDKEKKNYLIEDNVNKLEIAEYIKKFEEEDITFEKINDRNSYNNIIYRLS